MDFEGETVFTENQVIEFGALQLLSFAQIRFMSGSKMKFDKNFGKYVRYCFRYKRMMIALFCRLGASIVVDSPASLSSFSDLLFNPKCFILYEDRTAPPSEWNNVSLDFYA